MNYYRVEESLQVVFEPCVGLSRAQVDHVRQTCLGVLLAGSTHLTRIARWLPHRTQQDSRVQWLRRVFSAPYLTQERVYYPLIQHALTGYRAAVWHLVIDRTVWQAQTTDLVSIALNFRQRAVPLVWRFVAHGSTDHHLQIALLEVCRRLVPLAQAVIVHGDGEFGSVRLMQYLRYHGWDFVLAQAGKKHYRPYGSSTWQALSSLPVTKTRALYLEGIELTQEYGYGLLNLFAFYQPHYHHRQRKRTMAYCATSLPIAPTLRRLGHRRWGIECCFQDYKSAGWQIHLSELCQAQRREGLLTVLSSAYLWATCLGRWLCKSGQRCQVDAQSQRHLSLLSVNRV